MILDLSAFRRLLLCVACLSLSFAVTAQEEAPKKTFFLPKNPTAAAYVLGRLSNKELIEAPRSEFVYVALLQRNGLDKKYRTEALEGLAKARNTDNLTELVRGLTELDKKGAASEPVLRDLAALLLRTKSADLAAARAALQKLAIDAQLPLSRQIGYAALVSADDGAGKVWPETESDAARRADLLLSIPLVREAGLRATLYPKIEPLLHQADPTEVRRAAITAIAAVPGHDVDTFNTLSTLVQSGTERAAAIASLQQIPRTAWPKNQSEPLVESVLAYLQSLPADQRTEPAAIGAVQFATDLASLLPAEQSAAAAKSLRAIGVSVFVLRTIREQMLYDRTRLVVEVGRPVQIVYENPDAMPHNFVVTAPGAREEIGKLADTMAPEPDAQGRMFVPKSSKVIFASKLVNPGEKARLNFTAPAEPGEYTYVCTFPGHWVRMFGALVVTKDVDDYLARHPESDAPKITEWKLTDFVEDLKRLDMHRSFATGKALFTSLGCVQCHQLGKEGAVFGPNLSGVFTKWKNDPQAVLEQILEPSKVIEPPFRAQSLDLGDENILIGIVLAEDQNEVTIQTGPSAALVQKAKKSAIKSRGAQELSLMPAGLLSLLDKEQILDLLAYLRAEGNPEHAAFQHDH